MRRPSPHSLRSALPATLLGLGLGGGLLVLLFFWKLAFTNLILARGDTFLYFYPYWAYRAQAMLAGHLPLWDPYLFMGAPFLANSQAGVFYPLNWLLVFFPAPVAVKISILIHLLLAAAGAGLFARRALGQSVPAAGLAAALFVFGGYLPSQMEHINQLQCLAWFPWLLLVAHSFLSRLGEGPGLRGSAAASHLGLGALVLALQLLAGHSQSAFISLAGVALYALCLSFPAAPDKPANWRGRLGRLGQWVGPLVLFLAAAGLGAALLSAAQLLPTFELTQQSLRGGGLPLREALSFSLNPRLLGRALLPGYSRSVFSEFVAYAGVAGLALAVLGIGRQRQRLAMLIVAGVGLAFALGAYNPLYVLLASFPPVNLFRVPARWLFLFGFGVALLAGYGLDRLRLRDYEWRWADFRYPPQLLRSPAFGGVALGAVIVIILLTPLANTLVPPGETGPLGAPALKDLAGWLLSLALMAVLMVGRWPAWARTGGVMFLSLAELFVASQSLPFNHLTTPEAFSSIRPAMTQFLLPPSGAGPAGRFLSMSALRFDPGDLGELHSEWDQQLPPDAVYDAIIATKQKEVLSPDLPLAWDIPAVDGYDGGILPLRNYAAFTQLFTGAPSADGRLRENLTTVPDNRLLSLVNARYLTTDKVGDAWVDGIFYDLQFTVTLSAGETWSVAYVPQFEGTALGLVMPAFSGQVRLTFADGSTAEQPITSNRVRFDRPASLTAIAFIGPLTLRGLSLIDERVNAFQSLTLGPYRLVHSGDVKIYENLRVLPRAFMARAAEVVPDDVAARARLADPQFDPARDVILAEGAPSTAPPGSTVAITAYAPEDVRLATQGAGYLVLTDAWYPGWTATLDGAPVPILRADLMFRAIWVPEGAHTVEFHFEPRSVLGGLWISGAAWAALLAVLAGAAYVTAGRRSRTLS